MHHSPAQHLTDPLERREAVMGQAVPLVRAMRDALLANALSCPVVTGGGTGTFHWAVGGGQTHIDRQTDRHQADRQRRVALTCRPSLCWLLAVCVACVTLNEPIRV